MAKAIKVAKNKAKPIIETDKEGKFLRYFPKGYMAKDEYRITSHAMLTLHLQGRLKHCQGHYFRFATPEEIEKWRSLNEELTQHEIIKTEPLSSHLENLPEEEIIKAEPELQATDEGEMTLFEKLMKRKKGNL